MLLRQIFACILVTTLFYGSSFGAESLDVIAPLKPLTPIAGTNLFCNLVYKWHDRLKPGCFCTFFTEKYADWSDKLHGVSFACNKEDQQYYETADADWIFERTDGEESPDEYNGTVKVRNLGAAQTMETWKSAGTWWVGLGSYAARPHEDMWYIRSQPNNKSNVNLVVDEYWWLAQNPTAKHRTWVYLQKQKPGKYEHTFVPSVEIEANMFDFQFKKPTASDLQKHTSQRGLIDTYTVNNNSPATLSRKVLVSETVTDEFSYGFSESFRAFSKVTGEVGIPFLASSEVSASFEIGLEANQNWRNAKEKTLEMSYTTTVPPFSRVKLSAWYDRIEDIEMSYTAKAEIKGRTARISIYNDIVTDAKATGSVIRNHLIYSGFDGEIIEVKKNSVVVKIKGIMKASVGVRGHLGVNGKTVETA